MKNLLDIQTTKTTIRVLSTLQYVTKEVEEN